MPDMDEDELVLKMVRHWSNQAETEKEDGEAKVLIVAKFRI